MVEAPRIGPTRPAPRRGAPMAARSRDAASRAGCPRPAENNQRTGVTMAAGYRLGAIAQLGERLAGSEGGAGSSPASSPLLKGAAHLGGPPPVWRLSPSN